MLERVVPGWNASDLSRNGHSVSPVQHHLPAHGARRGRLPAAAARLQMIPDLCHSALCGSSTGETTNASTTGLLSVRTGEWADRSSTPMPPRNLMPPLCAPGTGQGRRRDDLRRELQLRMPSSSSPPRTIRQAPSPERRPFPTGHHLVRHMVARRRRTAPPIVDHRVLEANFTNEPGAGGNVRFLKNVAGLWILDAAAANGMPRDWTLI